MKKLLPVCSFTAILAAGIGSIACQPNTNAVGGGGSKVSEIMFSEPDFGNKNVVWDKMIVRAQKVTGQEAGLALTNYPSGTDALVTTFSKDTAAEGQPGSASLTLERGATYAFTVEIQNDGRTLYGTQFGSDSNCPPAVKLLDLEEIQVAPLICAMTSQTVAVNPNVPTGTGVDDTTNGLGNNSSGMPASAGTNVTPNNSNSTGVVSTLPTGNVPSPSTSIVTAPGTNAIGVNSPYTPNTTTPTNNTNSTATMAPSNNVPATGAPAVIEIKPGDMVGKVVGKTIKVTFNTKVVDRKKSASSNNETSVAPVSQNTAVVVDTPPMPTGVGCFAKTGVEVCFGTDRYVDNTATAHFDFKMTNSASVSKNCTFLFQLTQGSSQVLFKSPEMNIPAKNWRRQSFSINAATPGVTLTSGAKVNPSKALFTASADASNVGFGVHDILCK